MFGGLGNDILFGSAGDDRMNGAKGDDTLTGGAGNDSIEGGDGIDTAIYSGAFADHEFDRANGELIVSGPEGEDHLLNVEFLQFTDGTVSTESLGFAAVPQFAATRSAYVPEAEPVEIADEPVTRNAPAVKTETADNSHLFTGDGDANRLKGSNKGDLMSGGGGDDTLIGGKGRDTLKGGQGDDDLLGGKGRDILRGGAGDDVLAGGRFHDRLIGAAGDDVLFGGIGRDIMTGGKGADLFVFGRNSGNDRITDFTSGVDQMRFLNGAEDITDLKFIDRGENTLIRFAGGSVLILDQDSEDFNASDFLF